ncbi:MAG: delta-class carbonic anhydrase [Pseudomonadota bacterium]|jgi:carbonic anhydrase|uniref:Cadmium carbonic anhydrase n=1 Tax=Thalassolituus maritimus TaxID=484498 RepID=A0ABP9ZY23_9GAMM|nr:delta-class carbonic anhydrase [Pseudomonadota bacterium]MEC8103812.1 delta-class carbonic anhydrase [Pseudomonadota bacterium]MEC8523855.1 delta-class carbonic anhydrase [Pseudomonadota bacterium]MEE2748729.1 delta-class carbonic anhydrase [Pseudomonadota bacterium]
MAYSQRSLIAGLILVPAVAIAGYSSTVVVSDDVIAEQRKRLAENTAGQGFGPQSPRDIDQLDGENANQFQAAPAHTAMNLCNIHFHIGAEHKGGEFTTYAGNGNGQGAGTGYLYDGTLSKKQLKPTKGKVCAAKGKGLVPGDTIEVHFVHTTAQIEPGPTLGACLSDNIMNPQLRVEAQVMVLANDKSATSFLDLATVEQKDGYFQAPNIPTNTGTPVQYAGSTTGPSYNEKGSPLQVSWSVRPEVAVVNINTVADWCEDNQFNEDHAHGVRNLVLNPLLLSVIK